MKRHRMFGGLQMLVVGLSLLAAGCANRHAAAISPPSVSYYGSPQFMPVEGTSASYAANTRQEIVHIDGTYYLWSGSWFASEDPRGPWRMTTSVPGEAEAIICARVGPYDPYGNYQLCAIPYPAPPGVKVFH